MIFDRTWRNRAFFALALTGLSLAAPANANNAAFSSRTAELHGIATPDQMPRDEPLLFTDAEPVSLTNGPEQVYLTRTAANAVNQSELSCMAEALYFEARGEGVHGQAAVAEVILNRVDSRRFPSTVCGVVNQRAQFSYTIGGKPRIRNQAAYNRAVDIARRALSGHPRKLTGGATYFHTTAVRPNWSHRFTRTTRIGNHIFYRQGGQRLASN
ncbi:MAG: cell wall hydrolase [Paracoccus sp. (in: a-proteobacteria)]|uniref:cell wall hydrolase n=1 Tax=Paracoccus sp. TaxID=267 RepID=UPI0026DF743E|nr:cell wall hydrolase [Paracoccus sp. (in: a-proteobacteria)]MDO5633103.1 cell wall hydrolase [Paracoccus sp. (in: a-proteobacteria)]